MGFFVLMFFVFSCSKNQKYDSQGNLIPENTVLLQPFKGISDADVQYVKSHLEAFYPNIKVVTPIDLPSSAYYKPRNRYRADSIISDLSKKTEKGFITLALTNKDISTTTRDVKDFGVFGLAFTPGNAGVVSSFRVHKDKEKEELFKVAIHELGHTQGLKHCPMATCYMRDANGKGVSPEIKDFCKDCKAFLIKKNWKFNR